MSSWYTKGAAEAKKVRRKMASSFLPEFWLKDGQSAKVIFLDREAVYLYQHTFNVRGKMKNYTCLRKGCPLCAVADRDPRYVAIYRVLDLRKYKNKAGKVITQTERYYVVGSRLQPTLERLEKNHQLYNRVVEITRTGSGTDTVYSAISVGKPKIEVPAPSLKTLKDYAPKTREELEMIAETLGMVQKRDEGYDDDEEEVEKPRKSRNYLTDDDVDEDEDEDVEEESEEDDSETDDSDGDEEDDETEEDDEDDGDSVEEEEEDVEEDDEEEVFDDDEEEDYRPARKKPVGVKKPIKKKPLKKNRR